MIEELDLTVQPETAEIKLIFHDLIVSEGYDRKFGFDNNYEEVQRNMLRMENQIRRQAKNTGPSSGRAIRVPASVRR